MNIGFSRRTRALILASIVLMTPKAGQATILTFENYLGGPLSVIFPQAYGDRVTVANDGTYQYSLAGGKTPNIVVDYAVFAPWSGGYGDLRNLIYVATTGVAEIRFTADPGFDVLLHSFAMAGWLHEDHVVNYVRVEDGGGSVLFDRADALIRGTIGTHSTFAFPSPLRGRVLKIRIDATNLGTGSADVGIDTIHFSQVETGRAFLQTALYPGITVHGLVGRTYRIEYVDALSEENTWTPLTNVVLETTPYIHIDYDGLSGGKRIYRAVEP